MHHSLKLTKLWIKNLYFETTNIRWLFDKFVKHVYKIVLDHSILFEFEYATVQYVYTVRFNFMFTRTNILLT